MKDALDIDLEDTEQVAEIALVADLMVAASESPDTLDSITIDRILRGSTIASAGGAGRWIPSDRRVIEEFSQVGHGSGLQIRESPVNAS